MTNKTYHVRGKKVNGYTVSDHPSYSVWSGMKNRCNDVNNKSYLNYGGRGIGYCDEWEHFENFANDMGFKPSKCHTLERVDNDKGYSKNNCIWATRHEQSLNRRLFSNNSSGHTGVKLLENGRYIALVNFKNVRYKVGTSFETLNEASSARDNLLIMLESGEDVSHLTGGMVRYDSTTGVRGVSRHTDGGYIVRVTVNNVRKYLGYFKDFEDAKQALENAKK